MSMFLRQSTASQEILLGPFVDSTDGNTQETALSIANTDIKLWKEGGTTEASKNSGGATHIASGRYYAVLDATDTDTVGKLEVNVHVSGALAVRREFMVLEEAVYDALFAASATGYLQPTTGGRTLDVSAAGNAGIDWSNVEAPTTTLALTGTTIATTQKVDIETIKTNPVVNAGTVTFPTTATLASTTNITAGTVTTATNVTTVNGLAAGVITATSIAADAITAAKIADNAIDRATFAADTGLQSIRSNTAQAGASTSITLDASASATTDFYKYDLVYLTGGTGVGQYRLITAYNGTTKVATVTPAWATNPDVTSTFAVIPRGMADLEAILAVAVSTSTAQLGVNVVNFGGSAGTFASGRPEVNTSHFGGTAGTFASGRPEVNMTHIRGTASAGAVGYVGIDWGNVTAQSTSVNLSATTINLVNTATTVTNQLTAAQIATGVWQDSTAGDFTTASSIGKSLYTSGVVPGAAGGLFIAGTNAATTITTALTTTFTGNLTGSVASVTGAVGSVTGAVGSVSTGGITAASIADGAIDRATFAADTGLQSIRSGTAQAGAAGTITLDASASSTTNFYRGCLIYLTGGTGVGQVEACYSYDGTTKVATMWKNWKTTPDNTTTFAVQPSYANGVSTSLYAASDLLSISGTAGSNVSGLSSLGTAYGAGTLTTNITGTLSTVTTLTNLPAITSNWLTAAGLAADAVAEIADGVWDEVQSGHTTAGTFGKYLDAQVSTVGGGTAASIADAVWDEVLSGHLTAGTTGYALNAAGSAGDPWSTSLPGSYTGTTAGFIIGTMRAATFAVQFPIISDDNSFEMVIGDDYYAADGRNLSFSIGATPSLSGATVRFKIQLTEDDAGYTTSNTYTSTTGTVSGSSTQVMSFDVPGTTTDDMSEGWHDYEVEATLSSGHVTTLVRGRVNALSQVV